MSAPAFRTIAHAIVARLVDQITYLKTCRFYGGEVEDVLAGMPFETPAAFVMFDVESPVDESFDSLARRASYLVVLAARSVEGRTVTTEDGAYSAHQIIEDTVAALINDDLGLDEFSGLTLGAIRRYRITTTQAIYTIEVSAVVGRDKWTT